MPGKGNREAPDFGQVAENSSEEKAEARTFIGGGLFRKGKAGAYDRQFKIGWLNNLVGS